MHKLDIMFFTGLVLCASPFLYLLVGLTSGITGQTPPSEFESASMGAFLAGLMLLILVFAHPEPPGC
jgi:hypothetical protein